MIPAIQTIIFDYDGILTDDCVCVNQHSILRPCTTRLTSLPDM